MTETLLAIHSKNFSLHQRTSWFLKKRQAKTIRFGKIIYLDCLYSFFTAMFTEDKKADFHLHVFQVLRAAFLRAKR